MLLLGCGLAVITFAAMALTRGQTPEPAVEKPNAASEENASISVIPAVFKTVSEAGGELRMAGTSEPNVVLVLSQSGKRIGDTQVDRTGNWTAVLPIDPRETQAINLIVTLPDGTRVRSDETLFRIPKTDTDTSAPTRPIDTAIEVPRAPFEIPSLVLLTTPGGPSRVIKSPFGGMPLSGPLSLGPIDYDESGGAVFRGRSERNGRVRIYANGAVIGDAPVQVDGQWFYIIAETLPRGTYDIVVALMEGSEEVTRITVPFEKMVSAADTSSGGGLYVSFGEKRWQVRRDLLGGGAQYTAIFAPLTP